ncbi:hypothetical protein BH09VER1_BH09VER1_27230 [soil metagenome]
MSYLMIDLESDGPIPGDYSMICFRAFLVEPTLSQTFYGQLRPISDHWIPEALAVSGFTRDETLSFPDLETVMRQFQKPKSQTRSNQPFGAGDRRRTPREAVRSTGRSPAFLGRQMRSVASVRTHRPERPLNIPPFPQ